MLLDRIIRDSPSNTSSQLDVHVAQLWVDLRQRSKSLNSCASKKAVDRAAAAADNAVRSINHELRSPLNAVAMGLAVLEEQLDPEPQGRFREVLDLLRYSLQSSTDALDDVVLRHSIERGTLAVEIAPHDLGPMVTRLVKYLDMEASLQAVSMSLREAAGTPVPALLDAGLMSQVIRNVLLIALRAAAKGARVTVGLHYLASAVRVEVAVDRKVCVNWFAVLISTATLLQDGDATFEGIKCSLRAFDDALSRHRGALGCGPVGDDGMSFVIELPLDHVDDKSSLASEPLTSAEDGARRLRYLIVDDTTICRVMVVRRLQSLPVDCDEAENGRQAVELVRQSLLERRPYDVIIMDNSMPVMTGVEATRAIRELGFSGSIYGVTGNVLEEDLAAFERQGLNRAFPKPLSTKNFNLIIEGNGAI